MVKYREILRLTAMGISQRNVAFSVGCATSTVQDVLRAARAAGLERSLPEEMDDAAIILQGRRPYMYSAFFCHRHRKWAEENPEAAMRIEWKAGEWTQVDWCLPWSAAARSILSVHVRFPSSPACPDCGGVSLGTFIPHLNSFAWVEPCPSGRMPHHAEVTRARSDRC